MAHEIFSTYACKASEITLVKALYFILYLRRPVQTLMIESDVIAWLFSILEEPDSLSEYAIEYTVALLMNLCLRVAGKSYLSKWNHQLV